MRHTRRVRRFFHSVFTKLLVVIVIAGFSVSLLIAGFFGAYRHLAGKAFEENIVTYADYLINDIGTPPSLKRAREVSEKTGLAIRYESPDINWSTEDVTKPVDTSRLHIWHEGQEFAIGTSHGRYFVLVDRGAGRFVFEGAGRFANESRIHRMAVMFFALLSVLLVLAYISIRRILRPVRWLHEGVQQVGAGNLDHRVPSTRTHEFRDLAESFNAMTERVGKMMHAKERLLLDVSHELRSPITRMKVALEFMEEGKVKESLRDDIKEMEQMVSNVLETYRSFKEPGALNLKPVDMAELIDEVALDFRGRLPGVEIMEIAAEINLRVDHDKIKTVLKNVISNSIKYSEETADAVQIYLKKQTSRVVIEIKDHGIGIPEEALSYVFEPFYRVDASRSRKTGGYGLGLSLSKEIMEAHGGGIEIQSKVGRGTSVFLYFQNLESGPSQ
ncbi:MAG: HAMP domain-containing histidine kinase [Deltaproteobacteria bacterium]|nr:HAMP domain-containing histidine kinase [Deltaproteobacteria bacterium]